jgi:hypothetical protein
MAKSRKSKTLIRNFLKLNEIANIAAFQLGGHGEWLYTETIVELIEDNGICSKHYGVGVQSIKKLIMEFKFPRRFRHRSGDISVRGKYMETYI